MTRTSLASAFVIVLTGVAALRAAPAAEVAVREDGGTYRVTAQFEAAATPATVLQVLSDYERIPQFAPGVKRSVVRARKGGQVVVEQEAISRVLMFSKRVHLILEIEEDGSSIAFRDTCGESFTRYVGSWRVLPSGDGATVVYELEADPAFDVPGFVLTRLLKKDSTTMIDNLRREMERIETAGQLARAVTKIPQS
jgi:carbon monoxide dehydrogenase subunit G